MDDLLVAELLHLANQTGPPGFNFNSIYGRVEKERKNAIKTASFGQWNGRTDETG